MKGIGAQRVKIFFIGMVLGFSLSAYPQQLKASIGDLNTTLGKDFYRILKVKWGMRRADIARLFSRDIPENVTFFYTKSSFAGKDAGIGVEFDSKGSVVQVTMGIPVGDISLEDTFALLELAKEVIVKKFGRPNRQLRDKDANRFMQGLVAYYYWRRRNTEVILLIDTDKERMMRIVNAGGRILVDDVKMLGKSAERGIALVVRRADYFKR